VREGSNVIVSRTFSKIFGMAGARAGYGCARADLIGSMNPFMDNIIPVLGLRAASAALAEKSTLVPQRRATNTRVRGEFCSWLRSKGVTCIEPHANFVFIDVKRDVKSFKSAMLSKGVAVARPFPPFDTMCRVTVGTQDEMRRFREAYAAL
jgi:histidinol-phosphate/aromatic aminotransferase/cobyric acid decarboxylase-like protein